MNARVALPILRPRTWGDCQAQGLGTHEQPCPWISCAHHLAWGRAGPSAVEAMGDRESRARGDSLARLEQAVEHLEELPETCALRVAEQGEHTHEEIGKVFAVVKERARQIEDHALVRLTRRAAQLRDEIEREASRPDLHETESGKDGISAFAVQLRERLAARDPMYARSVNEASARQSGSLALPTDAPARSAAPPCRVLEGEERARRIAELGLRDGRPQQTTTEETTQAAPAEETTVETTNLCATPGCGRTKPSNRTGKKPAPDQLPYCAKCRKRRSDARLRGSDPDAAVATPPGPRGGARPKPAPTQRPQPPSGSLAEQLEALIEAEVQRRLEAHPDVQLARRIRAAVGG